MPKPLIKINTCPFCGGGKVYLFKFTRMKDNVVYNKVLCVECRAEGPTKDSSDEAVKAWNTRNDNSSYYFRRTR